jgi:L-lactate dehydrogenase complex protein LldG
MGGEQVTGEQLYAQFKEKAELLAAEVHRLQTAEAALNFIMDYIKEFTREQSKEVKTVWADTPALAEVLEQLGGLPGVYFGDHIPGQAEQSLIGVSQMDFAIAESGTLAQDATDVQQRLVSTLPFVHIAVVPTTRLVASIAETIDYYHRSLPGYVAFISGPSRTADIERILTIGVHGPERLIIVLVDDAGGEQDG